jgi:hypothetical protein
MDEKTLSKYHRVKVLAAQGEPGERENAHRILIKLQQKHPNIEKAYAAWIHKQAQEEARSTPQPPTGNAQGFDWMGMANRAQNIFGKMMDFADTAFGVHEAANLVSRCSVNKRYNSKSVSFTLSIPEHVYQAWCLEFNPEQQRVFLNSLLFKVRSSLEEDLND